jgi:hypothetical protein
VPAFLLVTLVSGNFMDHNRAVSILAQLRSFCVCINPAYLKCVCCLCPIVFVSYWLYSLPGAPWTNIESDNALHVLMTYHFKPWDVYYWGQDRLGSIIPFLAAIPVKWFGLDAVYAVTWVIYALLLIGWVGFAVFLKNPFLAWILGVFLLIPPLPFSTLVQAGHPYPGQVFFFGLMAAVLTRWPAPWVPPTLIALAGGSIWASDFSIIILGVIATAVLLTKCDLSPFLRLPSLVAAFAAIAFLVAAKLIANSNLRLLKLGPLEGVVRLYAFSSLDGFLSNLRQYGYILAEFFSSPPYALLLLSGGIAAARLAAFPPSFLKRSSQVGLLSVVASCLVVAGSHWVELNKAAPRYLSITFLLLVLSILFAVSMEVKRGWKAVQYFLLTASLVLHLTSLIPYARGLPSTRDTLTPLLTSGCSAFLGAHSTAFLVAGMFPGRFLGTPHERSYVRSSRVRDMVLAQQEICLIKEDWLEEFPNEIKQFGRVLKKTSSPQQYGRFTICRYVQAPPS